MAGMTPKTIAWGCVFLGCFALACGESSTVSNTTGAGGNGGATNGDGAALGGASGAVGSAEEFFESIARTLCSSIVGCCNSSGAAFDEARCLSVIGSTYATLTTNAGQATYRYDANMAAQCLADTRQALEPGCESASLTNVTSCRNVVVGTLPAGAPCNATAECAHDASSGASCVSSSGGKICAVQRRVGAGDACTQTCMQRGVALSCSGSGSQADEETRCFENDGLYCSNGTCTAKVQLGEACDDSHACVTDAECSFQTQTCVPLATAGTACFVDSDCRSDLYCANDTCERKVSVGGACTSTSDCAGGSCLAGRCVALSPTVGFYCGVVVNGGLPTGGVF
jgi:hypothetical protein